MSRWKAERSTSLPCRSSPLASVALAGDVGRRTTSPSVRVVREIGPSGRLSLDRVETTATERLLLDITVPGATNGGGTTLTTSRVFNNVQNIQNEVVDARVWIGLHFHNSVVQGENLGNDVATYDLNQALPNRPVTVTARRPAARPPASRPPRGCHRPRPPHRQRETDREGLPVRVLAVPHPGFL